METVEKYYEVYRSFWNEQIGGTMKLSLFDATAHSFATIATGGFPTKNTSSAHFNSPTVELIVMIFMLLSGIHFSLLFLFVTGTFRKLYESTVVRYYVVSVLLGVSVVAVSLYGGS